MNESELRRSLQEKFAKKEDREESIPGLLGNGQGVVNTSVSGIVYVRVNNMVTTAVCISLLSSNNLDNLPIWLYKPTFDKLRYHVREQRIIGGENEQIVSGLGQHSETHRFFGSGIEGGTDVVYSDPRQILGVRIYPIENTLTCGVSPWLVWIDGIPKLIGTQAEDGTYTPEILDFSPYIVTTEDKSKIILITLDSSGALVLTGGSEVDTTALNIETDTPARPAGTKIVLGAVRMYYGQYAIQEGRENTDLIDGRWLFDHTHLGEELNLDIDDLGNVILTDLSDGDVLVPSSGTWINQTLAEAGISAVGHTHEESDITDLDHNATSIDGTPVDLTGVADGNALVYDDGEGKILPGVVIPTDFLDLTDTPAAYTGDGGKFVRIKATEDGLEAATPAGAGDMTKAEYDTDDDGVVEEAAAVEGIDAAGNSKYYGTDGSGTPGFYDVPTTATDTNAIHDNEANEISAIAEKTSINDDDVFLIEDSIDSYAKKKVKASNLPAGGAGGADILEVQVFM